MVSSVVRSPFPLELLPQSCLMTWQEGPKTLRITLHSHTQWQLGGWVGWTRADFGILDTQGGSV